MRRERLTIEFLGKVKFWTGLSLGVIAALILHFFFSYGREILRSTTLYSGDLLIPTKFEFIAYNFFFSSIAVTVGFGITVWFWLHSPLSFRHAHRYNPFVRTSLITGILILLMAIMRTSNIAVFLLYSLNSYDNHLSFFYEFPELLILLPSYFFLNIWTPIRIKFIVGNWFWYSVIAFLAGTTILGLSLSMDQERLNNSWRKLNLPYNLIVDSEIAQAKKNGIEISSKIIETLRFREKQRVIELAKQLKKQFRKNETLSADLIVSELILIKKSTLRFIPTAIRDDQHSMWPFVSPKDVYKQITITDDSIRIAYLKEILIEFNEIFKDTDLDPWEFDDVDGLAIKHQNRSLMKRWYDRIGLETQIYFDSLKSYRTESIKTVNQTKIK